MALFPSLPLGQRAALPKTYNRPGLAQATDKAVIVGSVDVLGDLYAA
ncbi:MAG: hypothetical protein H5T69_03425 [Chloroflexi bacterium]|nr:hypothetical protein [Chloroflexota bacterium]